MILTPCCSFELLNLSDLETYGKFPVGLLALSFQFWNESFPTDTGVRSLRPPFLSPTFRGNLSVDPTIITHIRRYSHYPIFLMSLPPLCPETTLPPTDKPDPPNTLIGCHLKPSFLLLTAFPGFQKCMTTNMRPERPQRSSLDGYGFIPFLATARGSDILGDLGGSAVWGFILEAVLP